MNSQTIKNVIFDIGNVLVKWNPSEIAKRTFGKDCDVEKITRDIFDNNLWRQLNLGHFPEEEAKKLYGKALGYNHKELDLLFFHIKESQDLIDGTSGLMERLYHSGYSIYAISDNVNEIVESLKKRYDFWKYLKGAIISSEVQLLKPDPEIYLQLLNQYKLTATESVFIDDNPINVKGATNLGFYGVEFINPTKCESDLRSLGLQFL